MLIINNNDFNRNVSSLVCMQVIEAMHSVRLYTYSIGDFIMQLIPICAILNKYIKLYFIFRTINVRNFKSPFLTSVN